MYKVRLQYLHCKGGANTTGSGQETTQPLVPWEQFRNRLLQFAILSFNNMTVVHRDRDFRHLYSLCIEEGVVCVKEQASIDGKAMLANRDHNVFVSFQEKASEVYFALVCPEEEHIDYFSLEGEHFGEFLERSTIPGARSFEAMKFNTVNRFIRADGEYVAVGCIERRFETTVRCISSDGTSRETQLSFRHTGVTMSGSSLIFRIQQEKYDYQVFDLDTSQSWTLHRPFTRFSYSTYLGPLVLDYNRAFSISQGYLFTWTLVEGSGVVDCVSEVLDPPEVPGTGLHLVLFRGVEGNPLLAVGSQADGTYYRHGEREVVHFYDVDTRTKIRESIEVPRDIVNMSISVANKLVEGVPVAFNYLVVCHREIPTFERKVSITAYEICPAYVKISAVRNAAKTG